MGTEQDQIQYSSSDASLKWWGYRSQVEWKSKKVTQGTSDKVCLERKRKIMQNYYLQEKLAERHRQELLHEAEQRRLIAHINQQHCSLTRRCLGTVRQWLVILGTRLKELETNSEHAQQPLL